MKTAKKPAKALVPKQSDRAKVVGNVAPSKRGVVDMFAGWSDRSPFNMFQCQACPALGMCGGGCPASAELKYGDRWHVDERICHHSRAVLEWLVWDTYAQL